jgi:hypothetical protein
MAVTRFVSTLLIACAFSFSTPKGAFADDFWMLFQNSHVTVTARGMTVSQILDRWSKIGGTVILNGAAIQSGPVTLQLTDVSERDALDILLRGVAGYIVVDRDDDSSGASSIGKILILPKSAAPRDQPAVNAVAFDASSNNTQPVDRSVEQTFVPTAAEAVQPTPLLPSPPYVPPGLRAVPVLPAGTARPGEAGPQVPDLFKPGSVPAMQPGQAPPLVNTIQVTGPGSIPPPAVAPGAP